MQGSAEEKSLTFVFSECTQLLVECWTFATVSLHKRAWARSSKPKKVAGPYIQPFLSWSPTDLWNFLSKRQRRCFSGQTTDQTPDQRGAHQLDANVQIQAILSLSTRAGIH